MVVNFETENTPELKITTGGYDFSQLRVKKNPTVCRISSPKTRGRSLRCTSSTMDDHWVARPKDLRTADCEFAREIKEDRRRPAKEGKRTPDHGRWGRLGLQLRLSVEKCQQEWRTSRRKRKKGGERPHRSHPSANPEARIFIGQGRTPPPRNFHRPVTLVGDCAAAWPHHPTTTKFGVP